MNEKNILMMTNSDFVIKLFETCSHSSVSGRLHASQCSKARILIQSRSARARLQ